MEGFTCFVFCFMNKYESRSLKCLFLSTSPIASSHVCWRVYNGLEYDKSTSVLLCFKRALSRVLWVLWLKSTKLSNCHCKRKKHLCPLFWSPVEVANAWKAAGCPCLAGSLTGEKSLRLFTRLKALLQKFYLCIGECHKCFACRCGKRIGCRPDTDCH